MYTRSKCCIIGIPDHQGIINVGGRVGAAGGPKAFRRVFSRFQGRHPIHEVIEDRGDLERMSTDVALNQQLASELIQNAHEFSGFSVVLGGGHDHGFSHLDGVSQALRKKSPRFRLGCINIDAHLDVRKPSPKITSGSSFYLALESGLLQPKRFIEFGIQSHCNAPEFWTYVENRKVQVVPWRELRHGKSVGIFKKKLRKLSSQCDAVVISLDMDAVAASYSPGVSAPQAEGFSSEEIIEMMEIAGREKKVVSLGVFELNPEHDVDNRSVNLAATAVYHFVESAFF